MSAARLVVFAVHQPAQARWLALLSDAEQRQAGELCARHRARYVNSRIALRFTVAQVLGCAAQEVIYAADGAGQLRVQAQPALYVSLSYAEAIGLLAVSDSPVGLDYEAGAAPVFWQSAARRYFCRREQQWLQGPDGAWLADRFVWLWTRRESLLKYLGTGLRGDTRCLCARAGEPPAAQRSFKLLGGVGTLTGGLAQCDLSPKVLALCGPWQPALAFSWRPAPEAVAPCPISG